MNRILSAQSRGWHPRSFEHLRLAIAAGNRLAGSTLSEVLISLMVMSIGVVSLATLFPISVLRSIQAAQLTNATIHRLNAEELTTLFPRLLHDPNANSILFEHENQSNDPLFPGIDNPADLGAGGDGVTRSRFIVDPLGATSTVFVTAGVQGVFGNNSGSVPPATDFPIARYNGGFPGTLWKPRKVYAVNAIVAPSTGQKGAVYVATAAGTSDATEPIWPVTAGNTVTDGGVTWTCVSTSLSLIADQMSYLGDSWQVAAKGIPAASTATSVTAPAGADLDTASQAIASGIRVRVILFSPNGKQSVVRESSVQTTAAAASLVIASPTITWTDPIPWTTVSRFRIETFDPRYSWLLSVIKTPSAQPPTAINPGGTGNAVVYAVVFHKRSFKVTDEQVYEANLLKSNTFFTINATVGGPQPFLKRGGFVFDAQNGHWYRVTQIVERVVGTTKFYDTTIDSPSKEATRRVMALPGIVEVYPFPSTFNASNPP